LHECSLAELLQNTRRRAPGGAAHGWGFYASHVHANDLSRVALEKQYSLRFGSIEETRGDSHQQK
jgi:hypothetical protein